MTRSSSRIAAASSPLASAGVENLIHADAEEIDKHQFRYGTQAGGSRANRRTNEACLGNGSVEYALASELLNQPLGHAQYAAPGILALKAADSSPACNILAHQNNARVQAHRLVDCLGIRHLMNCDSH